MNVGVCVSCFKTKKFTMIKSFAIKIISINRREKKKQMSYTTNIATGVMLTGELDDW